MEVSGQIHASAALPLEKETPVLDRGWVGPFSRSGPYREEKNLHVSGIEPQPSSP
jgi:hypothetical protein